MILVTGAAGYVGSQIVQQLHRYYNKPEVIGVDNLSAGYTCNLPHGFECFMGDVGHTTFMDNLIKRYKVRQIVHCAASVDVPESVEQPMSYYANNVLASHELIRLAVANKVEGFVFSSSAAVYGHGPDGTRPVREDDATRPCSPYGWSKLMTEQMLRDVHRAHGLNAVILRYFNVAGADPLGTTGPTSPKDNHLITKAIRASLGMGKFTLYGDGNDARDYVHVADVAAAVLHSLEWTARHNDCLTLNVGTGLGATVNEVLCRVAWHAKKEFKIAPAHRREGDPVSIVSDPSLIKTRFNWSPQYDLNAMVEHALKWEKSL